MLFVSFLFLATISQHALDAGPNTYRDPFQNYRPYDPLYDGLGGQRFDDRFVNDGLRFAPEFIRGNSIYNRSLLFDYQASTGWKLMKRNQQNYDKSPGKVVKPRLPLVESTQRPKNQINTRVDSRIDTRLDTRITHELQTEARSQQVVRRPAIKAVPIAPESLPPLYSVLSKEQIVEGIISEFSNRLQRLEIERKIFGDIQNRKLSEEILSRYGMKTLGPAMTILGLTPTIRLQLQLEALETEDLETVAADFGQRVLNTDELEPLLEKLSAAKLNFVDALEALERDAGAPTPLD